MARFCDYIRIYIFIAKYLFYIRVVGVNVMVAGITPPPPLECMRYWGLKIAALRYFYISKLN